MTHSPRKPSTGKIVAALIVLVIVLGGGGTAIVLAANGDDRPNEAADNPSSTESEPTEDSSTEEPTEEPTYEPPDTEVPGAPGGGEPGGGDTSGALAVARHYVNAVNAADRAAATELTCGQQDPGIFYDSVAGTGTKLVMHGDVELSDASNASVDVGSSTGQGGTGSLRLSAAAGAWCVLY